MSQFIRRPINPHTKSGKSGGDRHPCQDNQRLRWHQLMSHLNAFELL